MTSAFLMDLHLSVHKSCCIPLALGCMCYMMLSENVEDHDDNALVLCMAYFFGDDDAIQDHSPHYPALKTPLVFVCLCQKKETRAFVKEWKKPKNTATPTFSNNAFQIAFLF